LESIHAQNAKIYKAFCDENRQQILELLRSGEKCACVLMEKTGISQSAISYHMKILIEAGIVSTRQDGKWTHYSISAVGCAHAVKTLREITTPLDKQENNNCCAEKQ
jgi:ArsR family transcriptional regulator